MRKRTWFISLRTKLLAVILLPVALLIFWLGIFFARQNERMNLENARMTNQYALRQLGTTLEHIFGSVQETSLFLYQNETVRQFLQAGEKLEREQAYIQLNIMVQNEMAYEKYIEAVEIQRLDGTYYESSSEYLHDPLSLRKATKYQSGRLVFLGQKKSRYDRERDSYAFSRKIYDINNQSSYLGLMQFYIRKDQIQKLFRQETEAERNDYYLVENGVVVISSDEQAEGRLIHEIADDVVLQGKRGIVELKLEKRNCLLSYYHLTYPDWYLMNIMSCEEIQRQNRVFLEMLATILILVLAAAVLLVYVLTAMVLKPLKQVTGAMKVIEEENFHLSVPVKGNDEIAVLASSFNKMSQRLDKLVNQIHVIQLSEKNAQIKALQAYINPHFLYNTLDVICWMSRMEEAWETCRLVEALSKIFRMSVHTGIRMYSVREEIEYTRNYLMIQECRFSDRIQFEMKIEPGVEACRTVSFILQPLIENAITHGLEPLGREGTITVAIRRDGDDLVFEVANDGKDADIEEMEQLMENYREGKRGMAIASVNNRIRLHYDQKNYGLHFEANTPHGLKAIVRQPFLVEEGKGNDSSDDCR